MSSFLKTGKEAQYLHKLECVIEGDEQFAKEVLNVVSGKLKDNDTLLPEELQYLIESIDRAANDSSDPFYTRGFLGNKDSLTQQSSQSYKESVCFQFVNRRMLRKKSTQQQEDTPFFNKYNGDKSLQPGHGLLRAHICEIVSETLNDIYGWELTPDTVETYYKNESSRRNKKKANMVSS